MTPRSGKTPPPANRLAPHPDDPLAPRREALRLLLQLHRGRHTLDALMEQPAQGQTPFRHRDRGLIQALVFGVLRWRGLLDWHLARLSKKPLEHLTPAILEVLRLGSFQILLLDRVPASAAVHTSVSLARESAAPWAAGYVNASLRRLIREAAAVTMPDAEIDPVASLAVRHSLPAWLAARWIARFGSAEAHRLGAVTCTIPPITLRANRLRTSRAELAQHLAQAVEHVALSSWAPDGLLIVGPKTPLADLATFRQGWFQVQDEAAQLVTPLLEPHPGERVLDACAGLGGKTGHLAQLMQDRGELLAVDRSSQKLARLREDMARLGVSCVRSQTLDLLRDAGAQPPGTFDRVLLDAPCSGLGVLRRNPDIKWRHTPQDLAGFGTRQLALLRAAARRVRPGGRLLYCVCSFEPEESDDVLRRFLASQPDFSLEPLSGTGADATLVDAGGCWRTLPQRHAMDGFFAARMMRTASLGSHSG